MSGSEDVIDLPFSAVSADPSAPSQRPVPRLLARFVRRAVPCGLALLVAVAGATATAQDQQPGGVTLEVADDGMVTLAVNENTGVPIKDFIKLTMKVTGRTFVINDAEFQTPGQNINFVGPYRLRRDDFYNFFQTMLFIRGFACVPRRTGENEIVEIVSLAGTRRNEIAASARYVPFEELEQYASQSGVQILTTVPLRYLNPTNAVTQTRPFFNSTPGGAGPLVVGALGDNRSMLLQGFGPQVWAAYQVLKLSDVAPMTPDEETRVVRLNYATAEELELLLKQVLDERARRLQQAQVAGGTPVQAGMTDQVQVLALASLNALLVSGAPNRINEALDLIARLDVPISESGGDIHVVQLLNVLADDLANTLRTFLREDQVAEQQAQAGQQTQARRPRQTVITSHPESNSLLISASQSKFSQISRMVEGLDKRQPQVLIEAALVELSTNDLDRLGFELGLVDVSGDNFTRPFGFTSFGLTTFQDNNGDNIPDIRLPDFDNPLQGLTGGIIRSNDFEIPLVVNALANKDRSNILSTPSIVVNNNENALVKSEENRPTIQNVQGNATTSTGVGEPRTAGIELNISPSISTNDYLRLNIDLTVSRFVGQADPTTGGITISRQVQTQVTLPSGSTVVVGGIIEDQETEAESGIPFLKDIPILGALFRNKTTETRKTNLYFFVTPTILDEQDFSDLREVSQRKKLEASEYIGDRRLRIVDNKWLGGTRATLDDRNATLDDFDRGGSFDLPYRTRGETPAPDVKSLLPNGPLPEATEPTQPVTDR
ncbi:MAG: secretin N-terminal domain-containing protein [Planctomycetota bacterium]